MEILIKNGNFDQKFKFSPKMEIFGNSQSWKLCSKMEIFGNSQSWKLCSKMEILLKNGNFDQKWKFWAIVKGLLNNKEARSVKI